MRIIQAGLGIMGSHWLRVIQNSAIAEHVGFVEIDQAQIKRHVTESGIDPGLVFRTLEQALDAVEVDGVLIVTPPALHRPMAELAMARGLPVLMEKPLADTWENARAIVAKADETGVLTLITQNYRYNVQAQTVKRALERGEIGRVGAISVEFYKGPVLHGFHQLLSHPLLLDMTIHHFDMMRFFLDAEPVSMFGRSWNPGWSWFNGDASATLIIDFPDDVVVSYTGSWVTAAMETPWNANWRFEGEKGVLLLRDDEVFIQRKTDEIGKPKGFPQYLPDEIEPVPLLELKHEGQSYLLQEFYEAAALGRKPMTTCQDNLKSYRMIWDAIESFETKAPVQFPIDLL